MAQTNSLVCKADVQSVRFMCMILGIPHAYSLRRPEHKIRQLLMQKG